MQKTFNSFILNVQFCKSCSTHSWCTHHDQQKYFNTYLKVKSFLQTQFGRQIFIQGNVIPQQLVPIKPAQNKYFNSKTNKYVSFPAIGAFEVKFQNQLLFSKKKSNGWPNLNEISDKIYFILNGKQRTKISKQNNLVESQQRTKTADNDILTEKDNMSNKNRSFLDHADKRTTFHKHKKEDQKNFTLTDHFKNYHKNAQVDKDRLSDEFFTSNTDNQHQLSEMSSFRNNNSSQRDFLQFKRNFQQYGLKGSNGQIPDLLKRKAYVKDDFGKKQMIIRLDSIEEQSMIVDQNNNNKGNISYASNINLTKTNSTFQSKSKQNHQKFMKKFHQDFQQLEAKFKNFQQKVQNIKLENKKYDHHNSSMPKINEKMLKQFNQLKKKQRKMRSSQMKQKQNCSQQQQEIEQNNNPIIFARKKLKNVQDYINGTQQQKNQKLKRIYGEWKLLKKPFKGTKKYVSPYKIDLVSNHNGKNNNINSKKNIKNSKQQKLQSNNYNNQNNQFSSTSLSNQEQTQSQQTKQLIFSQKQNKINKISLNKNKKLINDPKQKFYSTARGQFKQLSNDKSNKNNLSFDKKFKSSTQNKFYKPINPAAKINSFIPSDKLNQIKVKKLKSQYQNTQQSQTTHNPFTQNSQTVINSNKKGRILKSLQKNNNSTNKLIKNSNNNQLLNSSVTNKNVKNQYLPKYNNLSKDDQQQHIRKVINQNNRNSLQLLDSRQQDKIQKKTKRKYGQNKNTQVIIKKENKQFRSKQKRNIKNQISSSKEKIESRVKDNINNSKSPSKFARRYNSQQIEQDSYENIVNQRKKQQNVKLKTTNKNSHRKIRKMNQKQKQQNQQQQNSHNQRSQSSNSFTSQQQEQNEVDKVNNNETQKSLLKKRFENDIGKQKQWNQKQNNKQKKKFKKKKTQQSQQCEPNQDQDQQQQINDQINKKHTKLTNKSKNSNKNDQKILIKKSKYKQNKNVQKVNKQKNNNKNNNIMYSKNKNDYSQELQQIISNQQKSQQNQNNQQNHQIHNISKIKKSKSHKLKNKPQQNIKKQNISKIIKNLNNKIIKILQILMIKQKKFICKKKRIRINNYHNLKNNNNNNQIINNQINKSIKLIKFKISNHNNKINNYKFSLKTKTNIKVKILQNQIKNKSYLNLKANNLIKQIILIQKIISLKLNLNLIIKILINTNNNNNKYFNNNKQKIKKILIKQNLIRKIIKKQNKVPFKLQINQKETLNLNIQKITNNKVNNNNNN